MYRDDGKQPRKQNYQHKCVLVITSTYQPINILEKSENTLCGSSTSKKIELILLIRSLPSRVRVAVIICIVQETAAS